MNLFFRDANLFDLEHITQMLIDDQQGKKRESQSSDACEKYANAFEEICQDPNATVIVGCVDDEVIACAQLNFLRNLTYQGGLRAQIEGVRVRQDYRSQGVGRKLFDDLIKRAKERGCHLVQLTTDKARPDAFAFYESLGFLNTHAGFKLHF